MSDALTISPDPLTDSDALPSELQTIVANVAKRRQKNKRDIRIFFGTCIALMLVGVIAVLCYENYLVFIISMILVFTFEMGSPFYFVPRRKRGDYGLDEDDFETLALVEDKRVLRILLDAPQIIVHRKNSPGEDLLRKWLPLLTTDDIYLLDKKQKRRLIASLYHNKPGLRTAILGALAQIGERDQLNALKRWKTNQIGLKMKPEVQGAYETCIATIEARLTESLLDTQLLRPSSPFAQTDTLLRPVSHKQDEDADTLLRAEVVDEMSDQEKESKKGVSE